MKSFTASQVLTVSVADETGAIVSAAIPATITAGASWVTAAPLTGNTVLTSKVSLTSAVKNLAPGAYQATLQVSAPFPIVNSPILAIVNLHIKKRR